MSIESRLLQGVTLDPSSPAPSKSALGLTKKMVKQVTDRGHNTISWHRENRDSGGIVYIDELKVHYVSDLCLDFICFLRVFFCLALMIAKKLYSFLYRFAVLRNLFRRPNVRSHTKSLSLHASISPQIAC